MQGYLFEKINPIFRIIAVVAGVVIMIPVGSVDELYTIVINVIGFAVVAAITLIQRAIGKKNNPNGTNTPGGSNDNSGSPESPATQNA